MLSMVATIIPYQAHGSLELVAVQLRVRDDNNEEPIPNATVYVDGALLGKTDGNGNLLIITQSGNHDIEVQKAGYDRKEESVVCTEDTGHVMKISKTEIEETNLTFLYVLIVVVVLLLVLWVVLAVRKADKYSILGRWKK